MTENVDTSRLDRLLTTHFAGKVVRKDLTKLIKEGANVPVYVLEYLLGMYCASDDAATIETGLETVKRVLAENYVRPDEAEKVKSKIRERGSFKVIDKVTVKLNEKRDSYEALLSNLGIKDAEVPDSYVREFEKLLAGGIWCIVTLQYHFEENQKTSPFIVSDLKPIQMPGMDGLELIRRVRRRGGKRAGLGRRDRQTHCRGTQVLIRRTCSLRTDRLSGRGQLPAVPFKRYRTARETRRIRHNDTKLR